MFTCLCRIIIGIVVTPIIMPLFLIQGLIDDYPIYVECYKYKKNADKYVKYDDIPYLMRSSYLYYNSYKDKIAILINDKLQFAYKYINKQTNKIVYVAENGVVYDADLEQYKIQQPNQRLKC